MQSLTDLQRWERCCLISDPGGTGCSGCTVNMDLHRSIRTYAASKPCMPASSAWQINNCQGVGTLMVQAWFSSQQQPMIPTKLASICAILCTEVIGAGKILSVPSMSCSTERLVSCCTTYKSAYCGCTGSICQLARCRYSQVCNLYSQV